MKLSNLSKNIYEISFVNSKFMRDVKGKRKISKPFTRPELEG